jgi:hypothetical protein
MNKKYPIGVGKYYFNVYSGHQTILINRAAKEEAVRIFLSYKKVGKRAEWLGCYNGKNFDDTSTPTPEKD